MLWLSMGVAKNVSMEAFYQFDAPHTQPDAAGTFWATNDFAAVGGTRADLSFGLAPEGTPNETIPRLRSEEHTSELQSLMRISYAVFCLKNKKTLTPHDKP